MPYVYKFLDQSVDEQDMRDITRILEETFDRPPILTPESFIAIARTSKIILACNSVNEQGRSRIIGLGQLVLIPTFTGVIGRVQEIAILHEYRTQTDIAEAIRQKLLDRSETLGVTKIEFASSIEHHEPHGGRRSEIRLAR